MVQRCHSCPLDAALRHWERTMLMTATVQKASADKFATLPGPIKTAIQNTSVRLVDSGGRFNGSGMIVYTDGSNNTTIVTAKHLLYSLIGANDTPAWSTQLETDFQQKVSIKYDTAMTFNKNPTQTAAIASITSVTPDAQQPWEYDVMILTSTDPTLATFATTSYVYARSKNGVDYGFLTKAARYLSKTDQTFVQTGFGANREEAEDKLKTKMPKSNLGTNNSGCLQYRFPVLKADATVTVYSQRNDDPSVYDPGIDSIWIQANPTDSTAPGDSGGGLFVVNRISNRDRFFLIGVTTGADRETSRTPCPTSGALRVNNVSTSLAYCYENGYLEY
jgi:Trypsin